MEIQEYNATTAALAELKDKLTGKKYDVTNATGMALAKFDRRGLVTLRTDLEKKRIEIKAPALERCRLIDSEANRIKAELLALETPIDKQIKVEEDRKAAEKAEKERLAALAQKVLDDKILEIGKMPLQCIGMESWQINVFLATLEARQFGPNFSGDTLTRAEAAKAEAVKQVRDMLLSAEMAEAAAVALKAEQEAEAARMEAERVESERLALIQREEMARQKAILDEQKRLQDIEAARLAELARVESELIQAEREAFEAEQAKRKAEQEAIEQEARDKQAVIDAENARAQALEAARQRALDQQAAIEAERRRVEAEKEKKAADKARKLAEAKFKDASTAFQKILDICNGNQSAMEMVTEIAIIAEANIGG